MENGVIKSENRIKIRKVTEVSQNSADLIVFLNILKQYIRYKIKMDLIISTLIISGIINSVRGLVIYIKAVVGLNLQINKLRKVVH